MTLPLPKKGSGLNTVMIDFDGTLAEPTWPSPALGRAIQKGKDAAIEYRARGYEVVIWTSRPLSHQASIISWVVDEGLGDVIYDVICDKPRYALFVDDRAVTFPESFEDRRVEPTLNTPSARCRDSQGGPCYHFNQFCRTKCRHDQSCTWFKPEVKAGVCGLPDCKVCR